MDWNNIWIWDHDDIELVRAASVEEAAEKMGRPRHHALRISPLEEWVIIHLGEYVPVGKYRCLACLDKDPAVTLLLMDPERYEDGCDIPDKRIYRLVCLNCGCELTKYVTDNTIAAVKELRDQMDADYGKSVIYPLAFFDFTQAGKTKIDLWIENDLLKELDKNIINPDVQGNERVHVRSQIINGIIEGFLQRIKISSADTQ